MAAVHWCFTWNDDWAADCSEDPAALWDASQFSYMVYQLERAETGQLHLQGFCSLLKKARLNAVKKLLNPAVHLEQARGRPDQAADYCKKEDSRVAGPWEYGSAPDKRGKKSPTAQAIADIQAGKPLSAVATENPLAWVRSYRGLTSLAAALSKPAVAWREVTVFVYWGKTRSGKTRAAMESLCADGRLPYSMPVTSGFWFDGYDGEDTLVIDDFYGQIKFSDMLRILDGHYIQIPVKGGFTWARWTRVFITSNTHPDGWWSASRATIPAESLAAMEARLGEITQFPLAAASTTSTSADSQ